MLLHVTSKPVPLRTSAAECWQVVKVRMSMGKIQKLFVIINVLFVAVAEQKPELFFLMARFVGQQPANHRAERSDACAGGDEDRIPHRRPKNEIAKRTLAGNLIPSFHVT